MTTFQKHIFSFLVSQTEIFECCQLPNLLPNHANGAEKLIEVKEEESEYDFMRKKWEKKEIEERREQGRGRKSI